MKRRGTVGRRVDGNAVVHESLDDINMSVFTGLDERRAASERGVIEVLAAVQDHVDDVCTSFGAAQVEVETEVSERHFGL